MKRVKRHHITSFSASLLILMLSCVTASCEIHTSNNGDLDGFWQLSYVDTLATGGTTDMRMEQISWAFQANLMELRNPHNVFIARFDHTGNSLTVYDVYYSQRDLGDVVVTDQSVLYPFGIQSLREHFTIINLDDSDMTLQSADLRLHLRKY